MIIIFLDFIDQLIDYPINCARLSSTLKEYYMYASVET